MSPRTHTLAVVALLMGAFAAGACSVPGSAGPSSSVSPPSPSTTAACLETPAPDPSTLPDWAPGAQTPTVFPVIVSSSQSIACGPNRFMFSFLDTANAPVAAPDRPASVAFYDLASDPENPVSTAEGTFVWGIEDSVGIYVTDVSFPTAGWWGAEFRTTPPGGSEETIRLQFQVYPEPAVIAVGDQAPASDTPTLEDVDGDVNRLSTDEEPVERFYETSVADALAAKEPFVLVFATPKFCASAQCGPTLDRVKPVAEANPELTFINVEPYELEDVEGQLQPVLTEAGGLTPAAATLEWKLLSEPWIFVVDGDGVVTASFEGIVSEDELEAAVAEVSAD
jgi:hypothetical protein